MLAARKAVASSMPLDDTLSLSTASCSSPIGPSPLRVRTLEVDPAGNVSYRIAKI